MNCEECKHYDYEQAAKLYGHPCEIHGIANPYGCKDGEKMIKFSDKILEEIKSNKSPKNVNSATGEEFEKWLYEKAMRMEWYVYYYDCNAKKICKYNVFDHGSFMKELKVLLHCDLTRESFADQLKHIAMYYYWSKCEWETVLKPWVGDDSVEMKIDVYDQLMMNWDKFVDYVWSFKED